MNTQITVETDLAPLHGFLKADLPDGVVITSSPPVEKRGIDFSVNIDINLAVDLTKIAGLAFATWLVSRSKKLRGNHTINIGRKQIPCDQNDAIEISAKEIEEVRNK